MTIAEKTTSARNDYVGNGARTEFPFSFEVLNEANSSTGKNYTLKVLVDDVEKTEDTDYTVSYDSSTRLGSITFTTAPASSAVITLLSQIALTQSTDYINIGTGAFPADSHEGTVDKLTLIARELDEKIDRSILLPESSTLSNVTIPVSTANASKFITVNGDGNDLTASEIADTVGSPVSTYIKTLLDDETAAAARTTLDAEQKANSLTEITSLQDADQFMVADNSDSDSSKKISLANMQGTTSLRGVSYLPNQITISNGTDTDHDIDFTAGNAQAINGSKVYQVGALTKQIDAAWSAGTNQGALDTGTVANDTPYYFYAIENLTTGAADILFTASTPTSGTKAYSGANMPSGWGNESYLGACYTDGSANIRNGTWYHFCGSYKFYYLSQISDFTSSISTSPSTVTLTAPPNVEAYVYHGHTSDSSNANGVVCSYTEIASGRGFNVSANRTISGTSNLNGGLKKVFVDSSKQFRVVGDSATTGNIDIRTLGWKEYL